MKVYKTILDFLFGKDPDIFDNNGEVRHDLGEECWKAWEDRYKTPEFNWKEHSGTRLVPSIQESQMDFPSELKEQTIDSKATR